MKLKIWLALFAVFAVLALANPGQNNGATFAVILLVGVLVYSMPTLTQEEDAQ